MKKTVLITSILICSLLLGCKKKSTDDILPTDNVSSYQKADDASAKNEFDNINDDIEKIYKSTDYTSARVGNMSAVVLPCGKVTLNAKNFKIEYNDTICGSKVKSGNIDVQLINGTRFKDSAAVLKVTFNNYKVYYNASKTSVTYNGTQTITNATGGGFIDLIKAGTLIHKIKGNLNLVFDSAGVKSLSRDWKVYRKKTFTSNGTATSLTFTLDGDTIVNGKKISEIGTNKDGLPFVNEVETPFHWENCGTDFQGPYVLKTGIVNHTATNNLGILGVYTGHFSIYAGYAVSSGSLAFDGTCASAGYKLNLSFKKDGILIGKESTWFQEY